MATLLGLMRSLGIFWLSSDFPTRKSLPLSSFLLVTCQGFPAPLMGVYDAWLEEFKRYRVLSKWKKKPTLNNKILSGKSCLMSVFNVHLNLLFIQDLTSPKNFE